MLKIVGAVGWHIYADGRGHRRKVRVLFQEQLEAVQCMGETQEVPSHFQEVSVGTYAHVLPHFEHRWTQLVDMS